MYYQRPISLLDFVISISTAIDHIDPRIANHHKSVAYIASQIAREMGLSQAAQYDVVIAGLLHDIGVLSTTEHNKLLKFDDASDHQQHCEIGYQLLNKFRHFGNVSNIIRHHHVEHRNLSSESGCMDIPMESQLLFLADRIDVLIDKGQPILEQAEHLVATVARNSGNMFNPEQVDAFSELAWKEQFWLDITSPSLETLLINNCRSYSVELEDDDLLDFAEMLAQIIDFRCHFTATHSSGVATVALVLAHLIGFSDTECRKIQVAGYLHDIGKLAIPSEILEKKGTLTSAEFRLIKSHAYYTYRILEPLRELNEIKIWAAMHHERLDGYGYPGRYSARTIPLGARVIAVADIFTALLEERPYRPALENIEVRQKLNDMANRCILDRKVVEVLLINFDKIDTYRIQAQDAARKEYIRFRETIASNSSQSYVPELNH